MITNLFRFLVFSTLVLTFSTGAFADTATYQKIAVSRFKEDRAVRQALAGVKANGYVFDTEPTAALLTADCTSQVCKPTFLVSWGATLEGGAYSHIITVGAIVGSTTHFGSEVVLLPSDKMSKLPDLMKAP